LGRCMKIITVSQLIRNVRKYFDLVEAGETVQICRNGAPVALLSPSIRYSLARWRQSNPLILPGVLLSKAIMEERQGR